MGYYNIVTVINVSSTQLCCCVALSKYDKVKCLESGFDELTCLKYKTWWVSKLRGYPWKCASVSGYTLNLFLYIQTHPTH